MFKVFILCLLSSVCAVLAQNRTKKNNVCNNYMDYFQKETSPNCWYNPDVEDDIDVIVRRHGYPFEQHKVTTEDGYISYLFRLPRKESKGIVMLVHPASATAAAWINWGNSSLGFILWDSGYDVWLANIRGNYYAREHVTLSPESQEFWDFSFHEVGYYDHPAQIDYIRNVTNYTHKVAIFGHSMGGTTIFVYASMRPEHSKNNTNILVPMAPGAMFKHIKSTITRFLGPMLTNQIYDIAKQLNMVEVIQKDGLIATLHRLMCTAGGLSHYICSLMDSILYGITPNEFAAEWQPIVHSQYPAGMSTKCYVHYSQCLSHDGRFIMFDYGPKKNLQLYGTREAPDYPMWRATVPIYIVYGSEDLICTPKDQEEMFASFSKAGQRYGRMLVKGFSHSDILYGKHVREKVNLPLVRLLNKIPWN